MLVDIRIVVDETKYGESDVKVIWTMHLGRHIWHFNYYELMLSYAWSMVPSTLDYTCNFIINDNTCDTNIDIMLSN